MTANGRPERRLSSHSRCTRSRNSARFGRPVSPSCSDSHSRSAASWALRWIATMGSSSSGTSHSVWWTLAATTGAKVTRTPDVVRWKCRSLTSERTNGSPATSAMTRPLRQWLTAK